MCTLSKKGKTNIRGHLVEITHEINKKAIDSFLRSWLRWSKISTAPRGSLGIVKNDSVVQWMILIIRDSFKM